MKFFKAYRFNCTRSGIWCLLIVFSMSSCNNHFHLEKRRYTKGWYFSHKGRNKEKPETPVTKGLSEKSNNEIQTAGNEQESNIAAVMNQNRISGLSFVKLKPVTCLASASVSGKDFKKEKDIKGNPDQGVTKKINSRKFFNLHKESDTLNKVFEAIVLVLAFCLILFFTLLIIYILLLIFGTQIGTVIGNASVEVFLAVIALLAIGISLLLTIQVKNFIE